VNGTRKGTVVRIVVGTLAVGLLAGVVPVTRYATSPMVEVYHLPPVFGRRSGDFTANVTGRLSPSAKDVKYRLNGSPWQDWREAPPRIPAPKFTIELAPQSLRPGPNVLEISARRFGIREEVHAWQFVYDTTSVRLPLVQDWSCADLEAQDGYWERIRDGDVWRVRPVPGQEDYDRIVVVTAAFAGARRVTTDVYYRHHVGDMPFGFGVLPLWGGRPDRDGKLPRRGWNFSLAWYYSHYEGVGQEFSYKDSSEPPDWMSNYRSLELVPDAHYQLVIECGQVVEADGRHVRYCQRMKWWAVGDPEPQDWMTLWDTPGSPLPPGEFCVALNSHRSQVEFGPVVVTPLEDRWWER